MHITPLLMVVCYLNVIGIPAFPDKADAPLIVNPDAILSFTIAFQGLQSVAGRNFEILKIL
jgi:hypothetical protein